METFDFGKNYVFDEETYREYAGEQDWAERVDGEPVEIITPTLGVVRDDYDHPYIVFPRYCMYDPIRGALDVDSQVMLNGGDLTQTKKRFFIDSFLRRAHEKEVMGTVEETMGNYGVKVRFGDLGVHEVHPDDLDSELRIITTATEEFIQKIIDELEDDVEDEEETHDEEEKCEEYEPAERPEIMDQDHVMVFINGDKVFDQTGQLDTYTDAHAIDYMSKGLIRDGFSFHLEVTKTREFGEDE